MTRLPLLNSVLDLIFSFEESVWFILSFEEVRNQVIKEKLCCCDFIEDACPKCVKAFVTHLEEGILIFNTQIECFYKNREPPYHHYALSLLSFNRCALWGSIRFSGEKIAVYFKKQIDEKKFRYINFQHLNPYTILYTQHEDDSLLNAQDLRNVKKNLALYYLLYRSHVGAKDEEYFKNICECFPQVSEMYEKVKITIINLGQYVKNLK